MNQNSICRKHNRNALDIDPQLIDDTNKKENAVNGWNDPERQAHKIPPLFELAFMPAGVAPMLMLHGRGTREFWMGSIAILCSSWSFEDWDERKRRRIASRPYLWNTPR